MSFAGVSLLGDGKPPASSASAITVTDSGYYLLVVDGYSRIKEDTPNGECVESRRFRIGGYRWFIEYYPNGRYSEVADSISLYLVLDDESVTGTLDVQYTFSFVDKAQKQVPLDIRANKVRKFDFGCEYGYESFMKREVLEKSTHIKDDSLTIKCDIVVTKVVNAGAATAPFVLVPASDMHQHLISLLQSGEGTDVTFEVGCDSFVAHRCVLASRSTVFKEELFGAHMNQEGRTGSVIHIDDIEARVFKLLLGFIYSDLVPEIEKEEEDDVMWQKLLVAAHKYDLQRLKLICEQKLCAYINTSTVATILVLAEQHHCQGLKDACLELLNSHTNLQEVMVLGGLDYLGTSCPLVLKEVIAKLVSPKADANTGNTSASALQFVEVPTSDMHQHFIGLLQSGDVSDVTFHVDGERFRAHRCVLAARSGVFRAELFGSMKEGTTTGTISIEDMEPKIFELLLSFIYSDSLSMMDEMDQEKEQEKGDDELMVDDHMDADTDVVDADVEVVLQQLLVAADRYDLQRLKLMCEEKLCGYISTTTVASILALADHHSCQGLKDACLDFMNPPEILQQVAEAGGLDHLTSSCRSVLKELITKHLF